MWYRKWQINMLTSIAGVFKSIKRGLKRASIYANLISGQISETPDFWEQKSLRFLSNKKVRGDNVKDQNKFYVAMYLRLSRDDNVKAGIETETDGNAVYGISKAESNSIGSQRELIRLFLNEQADMELYDSYVDGSAKIGLNQYRTQQQWGTLI